MHFLSVNVFSTKVLTGDTIFTSPNGDGTAILRGHPSHAKVSPLAVQRKYLHFSVILGPWVMVRPRELNLRPPALQSNALPTELILPRFPELFQERFPHANPATIIIIYYLPSTLQEFVSAIACEQQTHFRSWTACCSQAISTTEIQTKAGDLS